MKMADVPIEHRNRIKQELIAAGMSGYGLRKMEARHLPGIIHSDEHIKAIAYGLRNKFSGMLVATDQRIIYYERKPLYKVLDIIDYDMVSGVGYNVRGNRAGVILHTRIGDYGLSFVNKIPAQKFLDYIESARLKN